MNKLFDELKENLLKNFSLYLEDLIPLDNILKISEDFDLIFKLNDEKYLTNIKNEVFEFYKTEYYNILEQEREFKLKNDGVVLDVDLDMFIGQAKLMGSVKQVMYGNEQCSKFRPVLPKLEDEISD